MITIAPPDPQLSLLDCAPRFKLGKSANSRNAYGQAAQEIVCTALGLTPIRINGNYAVCFDAFRDGTYFEIKSCYRSGKVVIYDWRAKKDESARVPVDYAILLHNAKKANDGANLLATLNDAGLEIIHVPAVIVHMLAQREPKNQIKRIKFAGKRNGYQRAGYREGYRNVPVWKLREYTTPQAKLRFNFHGISFAVAYSRSFATHG